MDDDDFPLQLVSACPSCQTVAGRTIYDIGSGPEVSCASCEWCWGVLGQHLHSLKPLPSVTCPKCGYVSVNPNDIEHGYCGHCHDWTSNPDPERIVSTQQTKDFERFITKDFDR